MLYNLDWLRTGKKFPPITEAKRIEEYEHNAMIFDMDSFIEFSALAQRLILNFDDYIKFPLILSYQRLVTTKLADMVCGAFPSIIAKKDELTDEIQQIRDTTLFDEKLYSSVVDFSRFGVVVFRLFRSEETDKGDFTLWNPKQWFPIIKNDGTNRIKEHILAWKKNVGTATVPRYILEIQRHPIEGKKYILEKWSLDGTGGIIEKLISRKIVYTGDLPCLIHYAANIPTTTNIYGTSDYKVLNTLVCRATERVKQILNILDAHADPSMIGPDSMLEADEKGQLMLKTKRFYAVGQDELKPEYLTWNGQLESAFKALEFLLNQIYILSEMGDAFLGATEKTGQAISGTAMRFKMASPLTKSRRVANSLTLPVKKLMAGLLMLEDKEVRFQDLSIRWEDSLPKDPREQTELIKLQTGESAVVPLKTALMEQFDLSSEDALKWIDSIDARNPQGNTGVNSKKKGSDQSLTKGTDGSTGTKNEKQEE